MVMTISGIFCFARKKKKFVEVLEDWELKYNLHRFKYKYLYDATNGFGDRELLGIGGFRRVYKGVLPVSEIEVAVKRISRGSRHGKEEFMAEIESIGRLRHRNIIQLLGYCCLENEFLVVYNYMPNGSLDKFIYNNPEIRLDWAQRFRVIKGVAAGLNYLHQDWEQVVLHRDVKASIVLLDSEWNGRLGGFELARLHDHGTDTEPTNLAGTLGYLAPEYAITGKATTSTDVYSFGAFLLEVVCGRKPVCLQEEMHLVDKVFALWNNGEIIRAVDRNLVVDYVVEEVEMVLKLGLMCTSFEPNARPSMQQVVQHLDGYQSLPDYVISGVSQGSNDTTSSQPSYMIESFVSSGI